MQIRPPKQSHLTGIGYASLTDIVLLLLIFFLLSSSFVLRPGLRIQLPAGETSEETTAAPITVTITVDGQLYVDQQRLDSFEELEGVMLKRLETGAEPVVVLEADRDVALRHAVNVLDRARRVGIENLIIATQIATQPDA